MRVNEIYFLIEYKILLSKRKTKLDIVCLKLHQSKTVTDSVLVTSRFSEMFTLPTDYCTRIILEDLLHPRVYNELTIDQLPVGLIAQLVRALHRYRRGHGFDSRSGLNFFQALFLNCLS